MSILATNDVTAQALSNALKTRGRVIHDNTVESKANRELENKLATNLNNFTDLIKEKFIANGITDTFSIRKWETDQLNHVTMEDDLKRQVIRPSAEKSYRLGIDYINRVIGEEGFFDEPDVNNVQQITRLYNGLYWGRLMKVFNTQQTGTTGIGEFSNNFIVTSLATAISWHSLMIGTISKGRQQIRLNGVVVSIPDFINVPFVAQAGVKQIEKKLVKRNPGLQVTESITQPFVNIVWTWITSEDNKVCPRCEFLSSFEYQMNDPSLPSNPDSSHPNCRCRIMLAESAQGLL